MINPWFRVKCSLCPQRFECDGELTHRKNRHEESHRYNKHRASQNNIIGDVEWVIELR